MSNLPLVSIITSTLNDASALELTIKSIKNCSYPSLEYIVIDGGSTDKTLDVIQQAGDLISKFISESDTGIYDAWNKGVQLSTGQYIAFLGAGDSYLDGGLEKLVACAQANPQSDFISSKLAIVRDDVTVRVLGAAWQWTIFRRYMNAAHSGALHSRRLFEAYGGFDSSYRIAGDYEFLLRARDMLQTAYVDSVTVKMIAGGVSQTGYHVFHETELAKIKNNSISPFLARYDRYVAHTKRFVRNILFFSS